jgi:AraC-like DNA-binding protein
MSGLEFDLPAVVPAGLVAYAISRDVPPEEVFAATGLNAEMLSDPEKPVRATVMMPLWRFLLDRFPGEPITLKMAEGLDISYLGLAGQIIRHSPTLRSATERTLRYQRLYDPALFSTIAERGGQVTFTIGHVEEVRQLGTPIEFMAAATLHYIRQLLGERVSLLETRLETQPRGDVAVYERYFGGPVHFGQTSTAMVMDAKLLDRPIIGADPTALRYLSAYADGLLAKTPEQELSLADRVRRAIDRGVIEGDLEPEAIAKHLAMSPRSLQRHLAAEGLSFQSLCDEVRSKTALRLLSQVSTPIQEVAFVLGYQDVPSFYRAFKRWTGKTPAEARRALQAS